LLLSTHGRENDRSPWRRGRLELEADEAIIVALK
jgi:hypothetical protein